MQYWSNVHFELLSPKYRGTTLNELHSGASVLQTRNKSSLAARRFYVDLGYFIKPSGTAMGTAI